ncbi:MAG: VWA domain-containing protein [Planctomycetota bacterium]|nr:VWA domain-containing protein [Planctomycetota bacterium]
MRWLSLLLAASFLAAPAIAQDDTVKDFKRFYRKEKDPMVRVELILSLEGIEDAGVASVLLPILEDEDPALAAAALRVIIQLKEAPSRAPLLTVLEEGKPADLLPVIARAVGEGRWPEFATLLLPYLTDKNDAMRLWTVTSLGALRDAEALIPSAQMVTTDGNAMVRAAAVQTVVFLGKGREAEAGPALVAALHDASLSVSMAACRGLRTIRTVDAIGPLIEILELGEAGRLLEEIWPTLVAITDEPFSPDPGLWRRWWDRVTESGGYVLMSDAEVQKRQTARAETNAEYHPPKTAVTFMGVETASRNIVFVIDVSGSMEELVVNRDAFRERGFTNFQKLEIVKEELKRSIESLESNVRFNIHSFATQVHPWKKGLVPANTLNKKSAEAWIDSLKPIGGAQASERASSGLRSSSGLEDGRTNAHAGLLAGLGVPEDPSKRGAVTESAADPKEGEGDTMFFLTDGKPTVGEIVDTEDILVSIQEVNRFRKVTIHTIAIGDFTSNFLKKLADQNGGVFVDLGK